MDPKKVVILVVLLLGLVFAGKWACGKWQQYNPPPQEGGGYGPYGGGKAKAGAVAPGGADPAPAAPGAAPAQ